MAKLVIEAEKVRYCELEPEMVLMIGDGFYDCLGDGTVHSVREDEFGFYYINCDEGIHYLTLEDTENRKSDDFLVGYRKLNIHPVWKA